MTRTTHNVSTASQLAEVLVNATGGETILLAGGDYGGLSMNRYKPIKGDFASNVTIRSADPDDPARFSYMALTNTKNITFDGISFDYTYRANDSFDVRPFSVASSSGITIKNSVFSGDLAENRSVDSDGYGFGQGLSVSGSDGVRIENNEFTEWHRGAVFGRSKNLTVTGNDVHDIRSDGMDFAQVNKVLIANNEFHDFRASPTAGDHRDMIQFWTTGTDSATTDVTIRGNTFDIGAGSYTQSIFMRNERVDSGGAGSSMFYKNILIEENVIYNAHLHGITVGETNKLTIRHNTILAVPETVWRDASSGSKIPVINLKSKSLYVTVEDNVVADINGAGSGRTWKVRDNVLVQAGDANKPLYIGDLFVSSSMEPVDGQHFYIVRPDGIIEQKGAGATALLFDDKPDALSALFLVSADDGNARAMRFDATLTAGPDGAKVLQTGEFLWDFGDGTTARGLIVTHTFPGEGKYDVVLKVTGADGAVSRVGTDVGIVGPEIMTFDAATGRFQQHWVGSESAISNSGYALATIAGEKAVVLGGSTTAASLYRTTLARFFNSDNFDMALVLQAKPGGDWGEVFRVHTTMSGKVTETGEFQISLTLSNGKTHVLTTSGADLDDGAKHLVEIGFDGAAGSLRISIDGTLAASRAASGAIGEMKSWGLDFSSSLGKQMFDGWLHDFSLETDTADYSGGSSTLVVRGNGVGAAASAPVPVDGDGDGAAGADADDDGDDGDDAGLPDLTPAAIDGGYRLDLAAVAAAPNGRLLGDAGIVTRDGARVLQLDGYQDTLTIGRLTAFERSDRIAFSVDFARDGSGNDEARLVWNHLKLGLTLVDDGLSVQVGTGDGLRSFGVGDLGLDDSDAHRIIVLVDESDDHLQVVLDDVVVLDRTGLDLDFVGAGGREAGWSIGTLANRWFEGEVSDFRVTDSFDFLPPDTGALLT